MTIKQGCALELVKYAAITLIYYFVLRTRVSEEFIFYIPPILALFSYFLLNSLISLVLPDPVIRALERANKNRLPEDGKLTAVSGPVVALEESIISPFLEQECVAYSYNIFTEVPQNEGPPRDVNDFRGFAYAPCAIKNSLQKVQLYPTGYTFLDHFDGYDLPFDEVKEKAEAYIKITDFDQDPSRDLHSAMAEIKQLKKEADSESGRIDLRNGEAEITPEHEFFEVCLLPGETVTAIGIYSAEKLGLISQGTDPLQLFPGDFEDAKSELKTGSFAKFFMAVLMFAFAHGSFIFMLSQGSFE